MLYFKNKTHTITIRLSDSDYMRLKAYSVRVHCSISAVIRALINSSWLSL